jgi:hypothetical protein
MPDSNQHMQLKDRRVIKSFTKVTFLKDITPGQCPVLAMLSAISCTVPIASCWSSAAAAAAQRDTVVC